MMTLLLNNLRLNQLSPHYIEEMSNFEFRYVRLCDLDIPSEKYGQTICK